MRYLYPLTSLRFVAAAMIVVHHTHSYFGIGGVVANTLQLDQGVSFFFVLSGFILFYTNRNIKDMAGAWRFFGARIARIWPLHLATLFLTLLFVPAPWGPAGPAYSPALLNALLLQAWIPLPGYFFSFNGVSWSLSAELFFYICFPALAMNWRRTWMWKIALCAAAAAAVVWLSAAASLSLFDGTPVPSIDALVYINPASRILEFSIGILACHIWLSNNARLDSIPFFWATVLELITLLVAFMSMSYLAHALWSAYLSGDISGSFYKWLSSAGTSPIFAAIAVAFAMQRGLVSTMLTWRPFVLLGELSFALYMCHQILFRSLASGGTLAAFGPMLWQYVAYWVMALGLSFWLFKLVEQPCRRSILASLHGARHPF
jgi:peptidoglycan/LPS O-acetylase OafA/YrhL